jgi:hypothetical protein
MPEIKFSSEKAERWLSRIEKRLSRLSPDDLAMYHQILTKHRLGEKLDTAHSRALWELERKL